MDDVKLVRKIIADRDYQEARAVEAEKQAKGWQSQAGSWKQLYLDEKARADGVQEQRVGESLSAVNDLKKANFELHNQHEADQREKADLKKENIGLRSSRRYYFIGGLAVGGAGGAYLGYQLGKNGIPGLPGGDAFKPREFIGQRQFGVSIKF